MLTTLLLPLLAAADPAPPAVAPFARDNLVAWCIVPFDAKKRGPGERVAMLQRLGFKRYAYDWRAEHLPTFDAELGLLKKAGIELTGVWFPGGLTKDNRALLDALAKHGVKTQLWVMVADPAPGMDQAAKVAAAAAFLRPVAAEAAKHGHTVGLYNHGGWGGEPENQLAVIDALKLPNVGVVYNLHHGHDHLPRFAGLLAKMAPHLLCLNLNGMVPDGDRQGRKILPLGAGDLDLQLLTAVRDSKYRGPVGILGHTQDDAEERLRDNLDGLDWLVARLAGKPAGPRPKYRTFAAAAGPRIELTPDRAVAVAGLSDADVAALKAADLSAALRVTVGKGADPIPGTHALSGGTLRFIPRFPLTPGVTYTATLAGTPPVAAELAVARPAPSTVVTQVYPTADASAPAYHGTLPENMLRFYLHFSAPMKRGDVYKHISLLGANGAEVKDPFLQLDEELWSPDGKRFTLLFDPGRVKRGLVPRAELGPALEARNTYTLVVDAAWEDENGARLKESFHRRFLVGPPDDAPVDPGKWRLTPPSHRVETLVVTFEKPLDHALMHRMLWVIGADGKRLDGQVRAGPGEWMWSFTKAGGHWPAGEYKLVVDTRLEDVCGNRVGEPFEVDVFKPVQREIEAKTVEVPFTVE